MSGFTRERRNERLQWWWWWGGELPCFSPDSLHTDDQIKTTRFSSQRAHTAMRGEGGEVPEGRRTEAEVERGGGKAKHRLGRREGAVVEAPASYLKLVPAAEWELH